MLIKHVIFMKKYTASKKKYKAAGIQTDVEQRALDSRADKKRASEMSTEEKQPRMMQLIYSLSLE